MKVPVGKTELSRFYSPVLSLLLLYWWKYDLFPVLWSDSSLGVLVLAGRGTRDRKEVEELVSTSIPSCLSQTSLLFAIPTSL